MSLRSALPTVRALSNNKAVRGHAVRALSLALVLPTARGSGPWFDWPVSTAKDYQATTPMTPPSRHMSSSDDAEGADATLDTAPAPGSPFHHAFPVHNLEAAKHFYGTVLGCAEGRSSTKWQVN